VEVVKVVTAGNVVKVMKVVTMVKVVKVVRMMTVLAVRTGYQVLTGQIVVQLGERPHTLHKNARCLSCDRLHTRRFQVAAASEGPLLLAKVLPLARLLLLAGLLLLA
jgi:hypothetical protein